MEAIELIEKRIKELEDMSRLSLEGRGRLKELKGLKRKTGGGKIKIAPSFLFSFYYYFSSQKF